jgi:hypothetical protein
MADPAESAAATATDPNPKQDPPETGNLSSDQRKAVEAAEKPDEVRERLSAASRRARQAEAELRSVRGELQQLQDAGKSETEQLATRAERAEQRVAELERRVMVAAVAARHGIPAEDVDRLHGETEDELDADARAFAKRYLSQQSDEPPPDLGGGARSGTATAPGSKGFSDQLRRQAQRRR